MPVSILGETLRDRETKIVRIPVCRLASGAELTVAVHIIHGAGDGPVVGFMSAHHGEEMFTTELMRQLRKRLLDSRFHGTVLMVPCANPLSFEVGTRNTPTDMLNLNRSFPGNAGGWITEKIAAAIWSRLGTAVNALIDFHCGGENVQSHFTGTLEPETPYGRSVHELALLTGAEILYSRGHFAGTATWAMAEHKIPAVVVEIGGGPAFGTDLMDRGLEGACRLLRKLGVLDGPVGDGCARIIVREGKGLRPAHGGIFLPAVGQEVLGKSVPAGTVLGRVVAADTFEELDVLRAPYPATEMMMVRSRISKVNPGDFGYIVGNGSAGEPVGR